MKVIHQVTAALLTTLLLVVVLVAGLMYLSVERGFARYVRSLEEARLEPAVQRLERYYAQARSWDALAQDPRRFSKMLRREDAPPKPSPRSDDRQPPEPKDREELCTETDPPSPGARQKIGIDPLELPPRTSLYEADGHRRIGTGRLDTDASRIPLVLDGKTVGWLGVRALPTFEQKLDLQYLREVRVHLAIVALAATLLGIVAGSLLARRLLQPIEALRVGALRLTMGDYGTRISVGTGRASGELEQLARDFNTLATTLANDARARREWIAETSHELRTPVTVLQAEVEAMVDGLRPCNREAITSLHTELLRLSKLINDLSELARADRGTLVMLRVAIDPIALLHETLERFSARLERHRITVELDLAEAQTAHVAGDRNRLQQVYTNLIENSVRYTDEGGVLRITAGCRQRQLWLRFDDSAPGVPAQDLPRIFERFYRAEASRSRVHGGSGLGLAICLHLVEAHGGTLTAAASPLGGVRMEIVLPLFEARVTYAASA